MIKLVKMVIAKYLTLRRSMWKMKVRLSAKNVGENLYVGGKSSVNSNTELGEHFSTNGMTVKGSGTLTIGDFVHTGTELLIITSNHNFKNALTLPYDDKHENKGVNIGRAVWIGDRVIILGGVDIGEGAIIQAGSVVVSDIEKYSIAGGNPAKTFKHRDSAHYDELAKQNKFLKV